MKTLNVFPFRLSFLATVFAACAFVLFGAAPTLAQPEADLSVTKQGPDQLQTNQDTVYRITVLKNGPDAADMATLTDVLTFRTLFYLADGANGLELHSTSDRNQRNDYMSTQ